MEIYIQKRSPVIRWIVAAVLALCFVAELILILNDRTAVIDGSVFTVFQNIRDPFVTIIAKGVTFCANTATIAGLCAILLILPTRIRFGIPLTSVVCISAGCHYLLKEIIERVRPDEVHHLVTVSGFGFPSGHANAGLVFYLFLMVLLRRYLILHDYKGIAYLLSAFLPVLVFAIGVSRVYLGVHYPSDVVGGWLLGGTLFIAFVTLYDAFYPIKYRLHYAPPAWEAMRKKRAWRRPSHVGKETQLIEFPKNRTPWRREVIPEKRRREKERETSAPNRRTETGE
ncbi:MAG: phosphatase PAP2 family protein [Clostridiales Family XIII bacterium]|jgi:undecaprenyl-diphosphatase|nr:phosphatase PAP2 family protein [Clostridiales Family XIII bacterium]